MKILLTGGGTGGSVSPLLAVAEALKSQNSHARFLFVGGENGPESAMAKSGNIDFVAISAGKFKRYFALSNFFTPFLSIKGFFQALKIIKNFKPDAIFGAGSYIQVPVIWAAFFLKVPVLIHQQDFLPTLSNKLCQMVAKKITVTFEKSLTDFSSGVGLLYKKQPEKVILTGNPFRKKIGLVSEQQGKIFFKLKAEFPVLLVLGGGTGSLALNRVIATALPELTKFVQVIHITGKGKELLKTSENYLPMEFTENMGEAYAAADIVLSRCGLSTLTELSNLKKVSIIVPLPNSHQEVNAWLIRQQKAALIIEQKNLNSEKLVKNLRKILFDYDVQKFLSSQISKIMPKDADEKIAKILTKMVTEHLENK